MTDEMIEAVARGLIDAEAGVPTPYEILARAALLAADNTWLNRAGCV